jgi:hypothetical protein
MKSQFPWRNGWQFVCRMGWSRRRTDVAHEERGHNGLGDVVALPGRPSNGT